MFEQSTLTFDPGRGDRVNMMRARLECLEA